MVFPMTRISTTTTPVAPPTDEDMDVANERRRVLRGSGRRDLIRLENLTKVRHVAFWDTLSLLTMRADTCTSACNFFHLKLLKTVKIS